MKITNTFTILSLSFSLSALLLTGCTDSNAEKKINAKDSPEMTEAISAERMGDTEKAISLYRKVISEYKDADLAALQLAILLHEYKKDYLGAIFYYRQYIEGAGKKSTVDLKVISDRIEKAEQLLSAKYASAHAKSNPSDIIQLQNTLAELDRKLTSEKSLNKSLISSNDLLAAEIKRLNAKIETQQLWIKRIQNEPPVSSEAITSGRMSSSEIVDENGKSKVINTYEVREGDSLSVIAEYVYGDRTMWPKIRDANPDKIRNERVKAGDILVIP